MNPTDEHINELITILLSLTEHLHTLAERTSPSQEPGDIHPIAWEFDSIKDKLINLQMRRELFNNS